MAQSLKTAADAVLNKAVNSTPGVPGVVAVATDRNANIYELLFPQAKINCILDWRIQCREQRAEARKERRRTMR